VAARGCGISERVALRAEGEPIGHAHEVAVVVRGEMNIVARLARDATAGRGEGKGGGGPVIGVGGYGNNYRMRTEDGVGDTARGVAVQAHLVEAIVHGLVMPSFAETVGIGRGCGIEWRVGLAMRVMAGRAHHLAAGQVGQEVGVGGVAEAGAHENLPLVIDLVETVRRAGEGHADAVGQGDVCAGQQIIAEAADRVGRITAAGDGNRPVEAGGAHIAGAGDRQGVGLGVGSGVCAGRKHSANRGGGGAAQINNPARGAGIPAMGITGGDGAGRKSGGGHCLIAVEHRLGGSGAAGDVAALAEVDIAAGNLEQGSAERPVHQVTARAIIVAIGVGWIRREHCGRKQGGCDKAQQTLCHVFQPVGWQVLDHNAIPSIGLVIMADTVAGQGAGGAASALVGIGDASGVRGDVKGVEIDQVGLVLDAVGIVAGGAGGLVIADVPAMEPVAHEDALAVAFVAQGVGVGVFSLIIGLVKIALEERGVLGTVGAIGPCPLGTGALVIIVAVGAEHLLGAGPVGNQGAGLGGFRGSDNGVVRGVAGVERDAGVRLGELADDLGAAGFAGFGMAAEADLVFVGCRLERAAADGHALDLRKGPGKTGAFGRAGDGGVGVVAIHTRGVSGTGVNNALGFIMQG